jgi:hypothetical protein
MATTTNYSWTTPDDTALVKDGAAAIRSLGTAIDTTVFNNASAGIAKTLVDAKGDIIAATAADTVSRLAVGTDGQVLTADSTAATGLAYTTISSGGMTLISTTTISNAAVLLSSIPATYNDLLIVIRDYLPTTDGQNLLLRFNDDSTANRHADPLSMTGAITFNSTFATITTTSSNTSADGLTILTIPDYANTVARKFVDIDGVGFNDGPAFTATFQRGVYNQTGAISSLRFFNASNVPKSGTILLYGVK